MTSEAHEPKTGGSEELRDGDEQLDWEPDPPMEPPSDDGTEEDYPGPVG